MNGTKPTAEAADVLFEDVVGERSMCAEGQG